MKRWLRWLYENSLGVFLAVAALAGIVGLLLNWLLAWGDDEDSL